MSILDAPAHRATRAEPDVREDAPLGAMRWARLVLAWTVLLGCLAVLALAVLVPRVGGATPYTILTGSMQPVLPPGTLVVTKPVQPADIHVGSVITYQLNSGEPEVVTHRVVAVHTTLDGEVEWQTQGDANDVADDARVRPEQVRGELWYSVPHLGHLNVLVTGHERQLLVYAAAGLLALYAGAMFGGAARTRSRREA